jgi:DNA mismatch repair protein MutS2
MMLQSGLLIPVHPNSEMGIFKLLFIHIGDTQSLEFELSTYSSHLLHMKYFIENANGKDFIFY